MRDWRTLLRRHRQTTRYIRRIRASVWFGVVVVVSACASMVWAPTPSEALPSASAASSAWTRPVPGAVVRPFVAPTTPYGPGHRGVNFAAPNGTPVRAAGAGRVVFAGYVAGGLHVTVAHKGGIRTTYSFLLRAVVHTSQTVNAGTVIGFSGGVGPDDPENELHFSVRIGDDYIDPMRLFTDVDLTKVVRLAPVEVIDDQLAAGNEWRAIARGLSNGAGAAVDAVVQQLRNGEAAARDFAGAALTGAQRATVAALRLERQRQEQQYRLLAQSLQRLAKFGMLPAIRATGDAALSDSARIIERLVHWAQSRLDCTAHPPAADGTGGTGHLVLGIGGITSSYDPKQPGDQPMAMPMDRLGYHEGEIFWFSYADTPGYTRADSLMDLRVAARNMRDQLRALQRQHPGREVDLIAHSQGGVVLRLFLAEYYDPADATLPPLGRVITLSSPHDGAPAAELSQSIAALPGGSVALGAAERVTGLPEHDATSTRQLAPDSDVIRELQRRPLHEQLDFAAFGATDDYVVPATRAAPPGVNVVTVDPPGWTNDHSRIVTSDVGLSAVRLALEGRPPPCVSLSAGIRGAIEPVLIDRVESTSAAAIAQAADFAALPQTVISVLTP
jgi:hypothetical protein